MNFVSQDQGDDDDGASNSEYVFAVDPKHATTHVTIGGIPVNVIIDSGASSNILTEEQWHKPQARGIKFQPHTVRKLLYPYGATTPLKIVDSFIAVVGTNCQQMHAEFIVVKGKGPILLGRETSTNFHLLHLGHVREGLDYSELPKRFKCFQGLGKLRDFQLRLHVDETVKPVAQPPRRVPFGLRAKVEEQLDQLLAADVIEPAMGPTPWTSPVVIVPKPNGEVRLCIDMRRANEAMIRERHPIPTVEEVIHELNQSRHFSKLDLRHGYHQIELAPESRGLTTFHSQRLISL